MNSLATRAIAGVLIGAAGLGGLTSPASSQTPETTETVQQCVTTSFGDFTLLNPETPRTPIAGIELPAGVVTITAAHSWDAYPSRVDVVQLSEIWEVEFIGADGSIVGVSAMTGDVEDNVAEAHWNGSLGDITLSAPAVGLRAHHRPELDPGTKNSVHASDITVCFNVVIPTTTTTVPPPDGPTTTAPACPLDSDGNPVDPSDPDCPQPTTTAPACPLDSDGNPVDPSDPDCPQPTTTAPAPEGPTTSAACPLDSDGNPVDPADPDCPQPTTTTAPPPKGPTGPSLPVTGSETTLLLLSGMWLLAAGSTMVGYSRTR